MRPALTPFFVVFVAACAPTTPTLKLRTESVAAQHLTPEVAKPIGDHLSAQLVVIDRDLEHARERVAHARTALAQAKAEPRTTSTSRVQSAKIARAERELAWLCAILDTGTWRRAAAEAQTEVARAEALSRVGPIEVEPFRDQHAKMRDGLMRATNQQTLARSRFE